MKTMSVHIFDKKNYNVFQLKHGGGGQKKKFCSIIYSVPPGLNCLNQLIIYLL